MPDRWADSLSARLPRSDLLGVARIGSSRVQSGRVLSRYGGAAVDVNVDVDVDVMSRC
jgi:hypothetical protein